MNNYTKLYKNLITSTIWQENNATRILWITMLALSDADGSVEGSIPGIARLAGITIEDCEQSLHILMSPDKYSRSKDHDGRRIKEIDGGWFIYNRAKYRDKSGTRAEYYRRYRAKKANSCATVARNALQQIATQTETETETKTEIKKKVKKKTGFVPPTINQIEDYISEKNYDVDPKTFFDFFNETGWIDSKGNKVRSWKQKIITWSGRNGRKTVPNGGFAAESQTTAGDPETARLIAEGNYLR